VKHPEGELRRVSCILFNPIEKTRCPHTTSHFFHQFDISEVFAGVEARLFERLAALDTLLDLHCKMRVNLLLEFPFLARSTPEATP
jgi:hypothetical protein